MKLSISGCLDRLRHGSKDSLVSAPFAVSRVAFESPDCFRKTIGEAAEAGRQMRQVLEYCLLGLACDASCSTSGPSRAILLIPAYEDAYSRSSQPM